MYNYKVFKKELSYIQWVPVQLELSGDREVIRLGLVQMYYLRA